MEMAHIGVGGKVLLDRVLPVGAGAARDPQLRVGPEGRLYLLWREEGESDGAVHYALLEGDGTPVEQPRTLSDPAYRVVDAPRLTLDGRGRLHALWADEAGIRWAVLAPEGTVLAGPTLLIPEGRSPAVQIDDRGWLHLAWQQRVGANTQGVYYAVLDPESGELSEPEEMAAVFLRTGQRIEGPAVGLDPETGYVLWAVQDLREVASRGRYVFFPLELPRQKRVKAMQLEQGGSPAGLYPLDGQRTVLLVALSEMVRGPEGRADPQIAVLVLVQDQMPEYEVWGLAQVGGEGRPALPAPAREIGAMGRGQGQESVALAWEVEHIVTASGRPSVKPVLGVDDRSYLHLAWLETGGFGQYRVVYASTAPEVKRAYNALTLWDVVDAAFSTVLRLSVVVVTLVPMLILWALLPLAGLLVYHMVTGEEGVETVRSRLVLGGMLALEMALVFLFPPRVDVAWSSSRWVVPAATAAVVTARVLRGRGDSLLFASFFLFTGLHGLLQLVVYFLL